MEEIREKNDDQPLDVVIRTDPASGDLKEGEQFTMYVSDGPTPSELPPLAGQRIEVAMKALSELDLKLTVAGQEASETVPAGTILSFTVAGQQISGWNLLLYGAFVICGTLGISLYLRTQIYRLPAHRSMLEISEIIFQTCKTYLIQQGKFLLMLFVLIACAISYYLLGFGHSDAPRPDGLEPIPCPPPASPSPRGAPPPAPTPP